MQVFKDDKELRAYAKNMTVVILYTKIRDNDEFFILLNTICDAKIVLVEKNLEKNIGRIFSVCDKSVYFHGSIILKRPKAVYSPINW